MLEVGLSHSYKNPIFLYSIDDDTSVDCLFPLFSIFFSYPMDES